MVQSIYGGGSNFYLRQSQNNFNTALNRLSTGKRINSAADDAAGSAIAQRLTSQTRGFDQNIRNANDAISLAQVGDGVLAQVSDSLQRIRELSLQAANGTYSDSDRQTLQNEVSQLQEQISSSLEQGNFNGVDLFKAEDTISIQVGDGADETVTIATQDLLSQLAGVSDIDISTAAGAQGSLAVIDQAVQLTNNQRVEFGAVENRLQSTISAISNNRLNTESARSQIEDADVAKTVSEMIKSRIQQEVGISVQAQANASAKLVLRLLS